ncbi:MAG: hypothetical protein J6J04_03475 [Oscillospiraceae bacterium]|nr:hypothetical protein [Oscillospiraceae bacterium]
MENIPIIIDGETCGSVQLRREGAYMVCRGQAVWSGDMVRLWLYGNGEPGYLGVLIPDGQGKATLRKKFSMADFCHLPDPIEYCSTQELRPKQPEPPIHETDICWQDMGDGTLLHTNGRQRLIAFPAEGVVLPRGGSFLLREIEGKQYVIFPG